MMFPSVEGAGLIFFVPILLIPSGVYIHIYMFIYIRACRGLTKKNNNQKEKKEKKRKSQREKKRRGEGEGRWKES